ncbi:MAG: hypothetical protein U0168_31155 [Nannocystaceae bacterium]
MAHGRRTEAAPALPVWPAPSPQVATTAAAAGVAIASWRAQKPAAVALFVAARGAGAWADPDDHRQGEPWAIALARDRAGPTPHDRETLVLAEGGLAAVDELLRWFAQPDAPYVVAHGAQAALARLWRLAERPHEPTRLGCTRTAAVLLGEGAGDPRAHELLGAVAAQLQRALVLPHWIPEQEHDGRVQCAAAAVAVLALVAAMVPQLRSLGAIAAYQLECELVPAVVAMELAGTPCDAAAFERVAASWRAEKQHASVPERVTRLDKLISTYGHWPQDFVRADRIHARLHPLAADSGRFSCTDPNLQQVPSSEHTALGCARASAPPGHRRSWPTTRRSSCASRPSWRPQTRSRRCSTRPRLHRATAATLSGKPELEVIAHERKPLGAVNFGFLFGMGAERFQRDYARSGYGLELDPRRPAARARPSSPRSRGWPRGIAAWPIAAAGRGLTSFAWRWVGASALPRAAWKGARGKPTSRCRAPRRRASSAPWSGCTACCPNSVPMACWWCTTSTSRRCRRRRGPRRARAHRRGSCRRRWPRPTRVPIVVEAEAVDSRR